MNKIIKILTFSDLLIIFGFGLISPVFAVFITEQIIDGTLAVVGAASAIYLISKALIQLIVARRIDKVKGERDDFYWLIFGSFLLSLVPFLYLLCRLSWHLYLIQLIYGIGAALTFPGWCSIFTKHIDHSREAFEWSLYATLTGIGAALAAYLGGVIAEKLGFFVLFYIVGIMSLLGSIGLIFLYKPLSKVNQK